MKTKRVIILVLILSLIVINSRQIMAKERNIFVGDLIKIRVSPKINSNELMNKFKDFEIVDLKEQDDSDLITLRTFKTGEKNIQLGDENLKIVVKSTLEEIKRDGIFEGDTNPASPGKSVPWQYIFYILLLFFLSTGGFILWEHIKNRRLTSLSPYQKFIKQINNIPTADDRYFVKLTLTFKEYLESSFSCRIRGKTSSEIMGKIKHLSDLQEQLTEIRFWLEKSDRFKFAGINASMEERGELSRELSRLVKIIEDIKEG